MNIDNQTIAAQALREADALLQIGTHPDRKSLAALLRRCAASLEAVDSEALATMKARKDAAYLERNQTVAALAAAYPSGIAKTAIEGWHAEWHGCVYIDLPTGQASWHYHDSQAHLFSHLPPYNGVWDGHSTEEKYRRLAALAEHATSDGAKGDVSAYRSPIFTEAITALNCVKAWRDCDGNTGFPIDVRERIDAILMAYELRAAKAAGNGVQ